jgi:hypothetical protein
MGKYKGKNYKGIFVRDFLVVDCRCGEWRLERKVDSGVVVELIVLDLVLMSGVWFVCDFLFEIFY